MTKYTASKGKALVFDAGIYDSIEDAIEAAGKPGDTLYVHQLEAHQWYSAIDDTVDLALSVIDADGFEDMELSATELAELGKEIAPHRAAIDAAIQRALLAKYGPQYDSVAIKKITIEGEAQ